VLPLSSDRLQFPGALRWGLGRFGRQGVAVTLCAGYREQREVLGAVEAMLPKGAGLREWAFQ